MLHMAFGRRPEHKMSFGKIEVDGVDISRRIVSALFRRDHNGTDGATNLTLTLLIPDEVVPILNIPDEGLVLRAYFR